LFEEAALLVLMEIFWGKFNALADAFHCRESLRSMRATLVSPNCGADGVMQSYPVSWNVGSSDRFDLKARSPIDILDFLDDLDEKAFSFSRYPNGPRLLVFPSR
jgi:hypothetical protein